MGTILPEGRLAVGMQLPIQSQSTNFVEPWERSAGAAELGRIAQAADRAGFFYVAVCDHIAIPSEQAPVMSEAWWDTVATLGWLAGITNRKSVVHSFPTDGRASVGKRVYHATPRSSLRIFLTCSPHLIAMNHWCAPCCITRTAGMFASPTRWRGAKSSLTRWKR